MLLAGLAISVALALVTRLPGFNSTPLWLDEAWRANLVLDPQWPAKLFESSGGSTITTFGYAALSSGLNSIAPSALLLRLTSLLPSILSVMLMMTIVWRMTCSRFLGIGAALAVALNLTFIWHAKEFKPYSLELFLHLSLVCVALRCVQRFRHGNPLGTATTIGMLVIPPIATLTMANVAFLLPGYYLVLAIEHFRSRKTLPWLLIVSGAVSLALLTLQYMYLWSGEGREGLAEFWSADFYRGAGTGIVWILRRLHEILVASFTTHPEQLIGRILSADLLQVVGWIAGIVLTVPAILGVAAACNIRRPERFLLILLPILGVVIANKLMLWPLAATRPNLFLYGYFIVLVFVGLGFVSVLKPIRYAVAGVALAWLGLVSFPDDTAYFASNGPPHEEVTKALSVLGEELSGECHKPQQVLSTPAAFHGVRYYTLHDAPMRASEAGMAFKRCAEFGNLGREAYVDARGFGDELRKRLNESSPIWIVWTHLNANEAKAMLDAVRPFAIVDEMHEFSDAGIFRVNLAIKVSNENAAEAR